MKKYVLIVISILIIGDCFGQTAYITNSNDNIVFRNKTIGTRALIPLYDSVKTWLGDTISNVWTERERDFPFTYDANNNQIYHLTQGHPLTTWINDFQYIYTFDINNNLINELLQEWNGTSWFDVRQNTYTYDVNNNMMSELEQQGSSGTLVNQYQFFYNYDVNNNRINFLEQGWNGTSWLNSLQGVYSYDVNNNLINSLSQSWNGISWHNSYQYFYTYDINNNQIKILGQDFNFGYWDNYIQNIYTYDVNNNVTHFLQQGWNNTYWSNSNQYFYTYDVNNIKLSEVRQTVYSPFNLNWYNVDSIYYYFHTATGISEINNPQSEINISPTPFTSLTTITFNEEQKNTSLIITDILGNIIQQSTVNGKQSTIDMSGFAKGIYFVRITDEKKNVVNRKMVKN